MKINKFEIAVNVAQIGLKYEALIWIVWIFRI